jgi:hypothetical protein
MGSCACRDYLPHPPHTRRHYREDSFPHISDSGSCDISGSGIGASVTVALGALRVGDGK